MRAIKLLSLWLAASLMLISCANTIKTRATEIVVERAKFDMECEEVSTKLLGDIIYPSEDVSKMSFGVNGCDKKASYDVTCTPSSSINDISLSQNCSARLNSLTGGKSMTISDGD